MADTCLVVWPFVLGCVCGLTSPIGPAKSRTQPLGALTCCLALYSFLHHRGRFVFFVQFCVQFSGSVSDICVVLLCLRGRESVKECLPFKTRPLLILCLLSSLSLFAGVFVVDVFSFLSQVLGKPKPVVVWVSPCDSSSRTRNSTSTRTPSSASTPRFSTCTCFFRRRSRGLFWFFLGYGGMLWKNLLDVRISVFGFVLSFFGFVTMPFCSPLF